MGVEEIYLIHHSHTDVGYTHDQPIVWELHIRFLERALELCEEWKGSDEPHAFRWTVENTGVLLRWLEQASDEQVDRFLQLVRAGNIEVTAMPYNITPLYDTDELVEGLLPLRRLRELGIPIKCAMQSDVNGQNWPLVDVLLEAGIEAFSMATNIHFGGSPLQWPNAFWWRGPSGRSILAWNGWDYGFAHEAGIDRSLRDLRDVWWPRIDAWLREREYPLPALMLQLYDAFGDNGPPSPTVSQFVARWNQEVGHPVLRLALPSQWWMEVAKHSELLPTYEGDWTDYWNFGCGSSARETAINRESRSRLRAADAAMAPLENPPKRWWSLRGEAWRAVMLWDEHTWGADISVRHPQSADTISQWHHKAHHAYQARSLSLLLARDAVAELARKVARDQEDLLLLFNPLSWPRKVSGPLMGTHLMARGRPDDPTAARHWADRNLPDQQVVLTGQVEVPAYGYTLVSGRLLSTESPEQTSEAVVETASHRVELDLDRGGIRSWQVTGGGREIVDQRSSMTLGGWIHEVPLIPPEHSTNPRRALWAPVERRLGLDRGWQRGWRAKRSGPAKLLGHEVRRWPSGVMVTQRWMTPYGGELVWRLWVPEWEDWIELAAYWEMGMGSDPEATYLAFPLGLTHPIARVDLGGQAIEVDSMQLPRACRDYYTVQGWVDVAGDGHGVTIACPDAPMVQLGGFTFAKDQQRVELETPLVLGWVTNNYWETNFRAHQPGLVGSRYRLMPYEGSFNEARAHMFGLETSCQLLAQPLREPTAGTLPSSGTFLQLPSPPVTPLRIWRDEDNLMIRLHNASDSPQEAMLEPGLLVILGAYKCDLWGQPQQELPVIQERVSLQLPPRALATLSLQVTWG